MNMVRRQTDTKKKKKKTKYLKKTFPGTTLSTKNPSLQCQICGGQGSTETDLSLHFPSQYHSASAPYSFMHLPLTLDHLSNWVHHSIKHLKKVLNQSPISEGYTFVQNFWISLIFNWWTGGFRFWRFNCRGRLFLLKAFTAYPTISRKILAQKST